MALIEDDLEQFDDRLSVLEQAVKGVETVLTRIDHSLFGNGQPGELTNIKSRLQALEVRVANIPEMERVGRLELELAKMAGKAEANSGWWRNVQPILMAILGSGLTMLTAKWVK